MKKKVENTGITLIALIVTIVILLILAGVTLNLVLGDNGIISKAKEAKEKTIAAQQKESLELSYIDAIISANTSENEEDIIKIIEDAITKLNLRGIYIIQVTINQDNETGKFILDCVREDNGSLYRTETGFLADIGNDSGMNIRDIIVDNVHQVYTIDDEAMPLYLIFSNIMDGNTEVPEEIEILNNQTLIYKEQTYAVVKTQSSNVMEIYLRKIKTVNVADEIWKDVVIDGVGASAMAIDQDNDLYCFLKDSGSFQLISTTTPKYIMSNVEQVVPASEEEYYIKTYDGKWYYFDYWNNDNTNCTESTVLEEMNIKQFVNGKILDQGGCLWYIRNNKINPLNAGTTFNEIKDNGLLVDSSGNTWAYSTNLNEEGLNIKNKEIVYYRNGYSSYKIVLYKDGEIQIYDENKQGVDWNYGKVKCISSSPSIYGDIIVCDDNSMYIMDYDNKTINKVDNNINIKEVYYNYIIDINNDIWRFEIDNGTFIKLTDELENKAIKKIDASMYGMIIVDESGKMYQLDYFGTGPR